MSLLVCQFSVGDCNARVRYPRKVNHRAAPVRKEQPQRRTFISALLMAEITYLEGLLADQQSGRKPSKKPSSGKHQAHKAPKQHPAKAQYQGPTRPEKYVSKLDPFHMIAAPDLTKEKAKETTKETYDVPAAETTTNKYGELEHYNLKGYLPPLETETDTSQVTDSYATPAPAPANTYQLVQAPAAPSYAAQEFSYEAPAPAPAYSPPASPEPLYAAPASTYPAPQPEPAYKAPAAAPAPAYKVEAAPPTSYQQHSHPLTFFHDAQASAVHETGSQGAGAAGADSAAAGTGEWPTVYYNTFDGSKKTLIL